ncbi:MAG: LLM class flavin-dependent oxidoreductase [Actinopolymorphaceae bacterium]
MRLSVTLGPAGPGRDPRALADLAAAAEDAGWDALFLEDYLVYQGTSLPTYDPWICLAAVAAKTEHLRMGTTVTPVPRRRPWKLASEAVSLDHLSGGRLILGVGAGDDGDPCMSRVGEPTGARVRAERLDEALSLIARFWTGETVSHHGTHYQMEDVRLSATPVQRPRIPIWVGGDLLVPAVRRRIARWDGSCAYKGTPGTGPHLPITPDDVAGLLTLVEGVRGSRTGFDVKVSGSDHPDDIAALAAAGATWWGRFIPPMAYAETFAIIRQGPPRP